MPKHHVLNSEEDRRSKFTTSSHCKKFKPQDVIKMGPQARVPYEKQNADEAPVEKQLSEAEIQLKDMVKKQLDKKITLASELARKSKFLPAAIYKEDQEKRAGALSLEEFKHSTEEELKIQELRNYGLTEREIQLRNSGASSSNQINAEVSRLGQSELALSRTIDDVAERIETRDNALNSEVSYSGAREMTRHEMEVEMSLYRSTKKAEELKHLIKQKPKDISNDDPVIQTLREYEDRERIKRDSEKKAKSKSKTPIPENTDTDDDDDDDDDCAFVGPVLAPLHVRVKPLDRAEVLRNKLNEDEIRSISKFKNYGPGIPSKVLYIKNLPRGTCKEDLAQLFVRFESTENPTMEYKILEGRMKGQAFVTFKDVDTAKSALEFGNGFILKDKPIIIAFGRSKEKSC